MTKFLKNVVLYLLIIICAIMLFDSYANNVVPKTDISYSAFMKHVQQDEVQQVTIVENVIADSCNCCRLVFYDAADAGRRWRPRRDEFWQEPCAPL